jgi:predicted ATPase
MIQVVAATLGVILRTGMSVEESVADYLATKDVLLVLDNCEHLLSAAGSLVERLLRQCPAVRVLATSREALAVPGEQVWPLRSLPLDDVDGSESEAVRLFIDRAVAVRPGFSVEADTDATREICRRLDGIPLAIELAAARISAMSASDIAEHLDERFRLLTGGRRNAVERHQTLRATVDWSYSLLEEREQRVLERLGVFAGSFDTAAAEAVAAGDGVDGFDVLDILTALVQKSMVQLEETLDGRVRYLLLETLRQYARERLDERGDPDVWRRRHAEHYLRFAQTAGPAIYGPDALTWGRRPRAEADNLRAAVFWALDRQGDDAQLGLGIIAWLAMVTAADPVVGVGEWAEAAHELADQADPPIRTAILAAAGWRAYVQGGDLALTEARAVAALRDGLFPATPSPQMAFTLLIWMTQLRGDAERALELVAEGQAALDAIATDENADNIGFGHVDLLIALSGVHAALGDDRRCRAVAVEAVRQARERRNLLALGVAIQVEAMWSWHDHPDETRHALEEAITVLRHFGNISPLLMALALCGQIDVLAGRTEEGLSVLREAVLGARDAGDRLSMITALDRTLPLVQRLGDAHATAVLGGIIDGSAFDPLSYMSARDRNERSRALERARAELTPDDYEAARALGAAMPYDDIVQYAVDLLDGSLAASRC